MRRVRTRDFTVCSYGMCNFPCIFKFGVSYQVCTYIPRHTYLLYLSIPRFPQDIHFEFENLKNLAFLVKAKVHKNKNASSEIISPHCVRAGVVHLFQLSSATSFGLHRYSIVVQQILMRSFRCELWQNSSIFSIMNNMIQMSYSAHGKRNTNLVGFFS